MFWLAAPEAGLRRRIGYALISAAVAAGLVAAGWPAAAAGSITVMNRVSVVATLALAVGLPLLARRVFGQIALSRQPRLLRAAGYASVLALVAVETAADRSQSTAGSGLTWLAGAWTGEIIFLVAIAAYLTGLLAVTARWSPAGRTALGIGTCAGAGAGLVMTALPPVHNHLRFNGGWLRALDGTARLLVIPAVLATVVVAGLTVARRSSARTSKLPLADVRARQGVAAGVCAGAAAALTLSILGISSAELGPHQAKQFQWALPVRNIPHGDGYVFSQDVSDGAAGYLLVLLFFPVLGAGLGAWGGLGASGRPDRRRGGGGGGGGDDPPAAPPPPTGDGRRAEERLPSILSGGYLKELPPAGGLGAGPDETVPDPGHRKKTPARGLAGRAGRAGWAARRAPGPDRGHVRAHRGVLGAVAAGAIRAGVDEDAGAGGDRARAQPFHPELGDEQGQADDRARRVPVRYAAVLAEVNVPAPGAVADDHRMHWVPDQQCVQPLDDELLGPVRSGGGSAEDLAQL